MYTKKEISTETQKIISIEEFVEIIHHSIAHLPCHQV